MTKKTLKNAVVYLSLLLFPVLVSAQEKGIDQRIDEAFKPIADWWGWLIFYPIYDGIPLVLVLLIFGAAFFTVAFGFVNITKFWLAINVVRGKYDDIEHADADSHAEVNVVDGDIVDTIKDESHHGEVSHFQALATAVSGTVGLGNIAGVAVAIAIGGPGATFWMIVCGLLGMSSKFVECTLGVKYRDIDANGTVHGGPMYYLSRGFADIKMTAVGKVLAIIFAVFCIGGSFGGGNAFQANQATTQLTTLFGIDGGATRTIIGIIMAILVAVVIIGGIKRIATVTEKLVPFMAIIYILASLIIILMHFTEIPAALSMIISGAFTPEAGVGGGVPGQAGRPGPGQGERRERRVRDRAGREHADHRGPRQGRPADRRQEHLGPQGREHDVEAPALGHAEERGPHERQRRPHERERRAHERERRPPERERRPPERERRPQERERDALTCVLVATPPGDRRIRSRGLGSSPR